MNFCSVEDNYFPFKRTLNVNGKLIFLNKPLIFGVINCTPDSFFESSRKILVEETLETVQKMIESGVDVLDFGAYSSRPGAADINSEEELQRLIPLLKATRKAFPNILFSVDTFRASVARESIDNGANFINDISMCSDPEMPPLLKEKNIPYVLMHMRGTPQTMQDKTNYSNLIVDVHHEISTKLIALKQIGITDILIDLGYGFAKTMEQNYTLLKHQSNFNIHGFPIFTGISRKSMIYKFLQSTPENALNGTTILNTFASFNGSLALRVHDVQEAKEVVLLMEKIKESNS